MSKKKIKNYSESKFGEMALFPGKANPAKKVTITFLANFFGLAQTQVGSIPVDRFFFGIIIFCLNELQCLNTFFP
jgi:hypothetical protein